jgi:hypothetical protein
MSLDRIGDKTTKRGAIGRKQKIPTTDGTAGPELVAKIADTSISLGEVVQRLRKEHNINVTIPTVTTYLQMQWGKDYGEKKKEMSLRRSKVKRWKTEYGLARQGIADEFHKDYVSTDDGVFYNWGTMDDIFSKNELESLPRVEDRAYKGKDIINYSKDAKFGWKPDPSDPDALGTVNHTALGIMTLQLRSRIEGLVEEKKRKLVQDETRERVEEYAHKHRESMTAEDIPKLMRDVAKQVRVEMKPELKAMDVEVEEKLLDVLAKLGKGDTRTRVLHDKELYNKKLDPAYASSDKKWRGRQRMVSMPDRIFSRSVYNLPFLLWMHPKRIQVHSHNLSKKLPELLKPEEPKVKAEFNDIHGVNGRIRFPRNVEEHVKTMEAGMIVTEDFANKFRYFTVVEEGTLIADTKGGFPTAPRVLKSMGSFKDYKKETDIIKGTYPVDRLDPLTLGGFDELGVGVGNKFAKHSGELFLVGDSKERRRRITLAQGERGDDTREVVYYSQDYQIVREDVLKVGDKLLDRGGLKGIISDIVPSLGIDKETSKPYDLICNYEEVWREEDRSTAAGRLQDDTYHKQGKKKGAIVLEHEKGKGEVFFFMIDKFAQDSTTTGLSFSPTLVSGLWEWSLDGLEVNTEEARNNLIDAFASDYFRGRGNLVPTLKALHYKAVKKDGIVSLEIDDKEATMDDKGEIIDLPHTYAGNTYQKAYVPHSVARVYFDGTTFREVYISQLDKTPNDASDFYWFNIMKQAKNRFGLFPKMDWGIQLVTRPWAEDPKDPTKYHKVQMDYLDVIDMGGDPYDPDLIVTFRKEPVTGKESIQTHPVQVDFSAKTRGTMGMNPTVALEATIDYDGDTVVAFVPPIKDAIVELPKKTMDELKELKTRKFDESFDSLYKKAKSLKMAENEAELGVMCAAYNQRIAETENELIERLGGLRKRSMILQGKQTPPDVVIGKGTKYEETHTMDIALINRITDVEKILKMKEPRWKVKTIEKKPIESLSTEEWDLVRDSYLRKELTKLVNVVIKDKGVKKLYDLLREPSDYMKREFVTKSGYEGDPIGLKIDTESRLLDRILYAELRESDIFEDLDER